MGQGTASSTDLFLIFLRREFVSRCKRNTEYSLRSYARALDVSHSTLSQILRGRRALTAPMALRFAKSLKIPADQLKTLLPMGEWSASNETTRHDYKQIAMDTFAVISDWYHIAIVELVNTKYFSGTIAQIVNALGITHSQASSAVDRLLRVKLLVKTDDGKLIQNSAPFNTTTNADGTNEALKKLQRQMLEKALTALETVPLDVRDQSGLTMAIDPTRLPEAKEMIKVFRRKLSDSLEAGVNRSQIYHLSVSLFPLSNPIGD